MLWEKLAHRFPTEKYIRGGLMPALAMAPKDARYLGYASRQLQIRDSTTPIAIADTVTR